MLNMRASLRGKILILILLHRHKSKEALISQHKCPDLTFMEHRKRFSVVDSQVFSLKDCQSNWPNQNEGVM